MIDFTGEALEPGITARTRLEPLQRYAICREAARGKRVLVMGSGDGHGSAMLAESARQVIGVERNPAMVLHASRTYGRLPHLTFAAVGGWDKLPIAAESIDLAIAFGALSTRDLHIATLWELRRVLAPGGLFLFAWPNEQAPPLAEIDTQLDSFFEHVKFWGQRLAVGSFTFPIDQVVPQSRLRPLTVEDEVIRESLPPLEQPAFYMAVCSDAPFDPHGLQLESVAMQPAEDLYLQLVDGLEGARSAQKTTTRLHSVAVAELQNERLEQREMERRLAAVRGEAEVLAQALKDTQQQLHATHERLHATWADAQAARQELTAAQQQHAAALGAWHEDREAQLREWASQIQGKDARLAERDHQVRSQQAHIDALQRQLADVLGSSSWRLSAPIRAMRRGLDAMMGRRGRGRP